MQFEFKELYPWLYSVNDPLNVYCYLVIGDEKALLFDTGFGVISLPEAIKTISSKPVTVVLGHGHIDHANGAYQFNEVYLHEADFDLCREHTSRAFKENIMNGVGNRGVSLPEGYDREAYVSSGAGNLKKLDNGTVFDLGGLTLEVIGMPGHTAGSIGLLVREKKVLLDSDSANEHVWMFLEESLPVKEYIKMLEETMKLDFNTFFTGHSNAPKPKSDVLKYINAASNASIEKAEPYNGHENLNPYIYKEDDVAIVVNARTLGQK